MLGEDLVYLVAGLEKPTISIHCYLTDIWLASYAPEHIPLFKKNGMFSVISLKEYVITNTY